MRITIAAAGRFRGGPERALFETYVKRLGWLVALKEIEEKAKLAPKARRAKEAERLLGALPDGATLIALDETGSALSSRAFAGRIASWRDDGVGDLGFVIGGAEGLERALIERAALVLSLGPMTWPHLMVRAMLAEQLYRADAILRGHPYHRG
ncbi:MAG: 23S rRNA (pseudouridine(1915)-N(3))-methyltransferase RlmH [Alphaproteobacteria bacterium]